MIRLTKWTTAMLATALLVAACGSGGATSASAPASVTPVPSVTTDTTPSPTPILETPAPSATTPSSSANPWHDSPMAGFESRVNIRGYLADLNISIGQPVVQTSDDRLPDADYPPPGCGFIWPEDTADSGIVKLVTVRVVVELYPVDQGRLTWPNNLGVSPGITAAEGAILSDATPCDGESLNATTATPNHPVTAWLFWSQTLTPDNPNGWAKPYPWSDIRVEVGNVTSCKPGRHVGITFDSRYPGECLYDVMFTK